MNTPKSEQIAAAQKANAEAMLALMRSTLDNIEKLATLNLSAMREGIQAGAENASNLLEAKDPKQALAVQATIAEPGLERTRSYYHNLYELVLNMQKDITSVMESHYKSLSENAESAIEATTSNLPAGGDVFATALKSMLQASSQVFDRMNFMAQQMAQITDSNLKAFSSIGTSSEADEASEASKASSGSATRKAATKAQPKS
ncbi:MAG: phasin family protein [Azovibrio sp.]|uniref:phasin family protein n=1 Tax=Azovibrio sp. TaxID=1872673 RepID=UPI003C726585